MTACRPNVEVALADEFETMRVLEKAVLQHEDEPEKKARVVQWFVSRFGEGLERSRAQLAAMPPQAGVGDTYATFAELFDAASPTTERDKALIAAFWMQVIQTQPSFASQSLNSELKDLGHGIGNITEALNQLKDERPALALQLKKSGLTKQARKTYKLTQEGIRRAQMMLRHKDNNGESE